MSSTMSKIQKTENVETLLRLVRKQVSSVTIFVHFKNLSQADQKELALHLHNNIAIKLLYPELEKALNEKYDVISKEFERQMKLLISCLKSRAEPKINSVEYKKKFTAAKKIINDIAANYGIDKFSSQNGNMILYATMANDFDLIDYLLQQGADPIKIDPLSDYYAWGDVLEGFPQSASAKFSTTDLDLIRIFNRHNINILANGTLYIISKSKNIALIETFNALPQTKLFHDIISSIKELTFNVTELKKWQKASAMSDAQISDILNTIDESGHTPLMHAILHGNDNAAAILIQYDINLNVQNIYGDTALHMAIRKQSRFVHDLLTHVNTEDPSKNARINLENNAGETAYTLSQLIDYKSFGHTFSNRPSVALGRELLNLISRNKIDTFIEIITDALLSTTSTYNADDMFNFKGPLEIDGKTDNFTLFTACAAMGNIDLLKLFLECNALDKKEIQIENAMLIAAKYGKLEVIKYLITQGASVKTSDSYNRTPLHFAVIHGHVDVIKYLIDQGADINARDGGNFTPLNDAVYYKQLLSCVILTQAKADSKIISIYGNSPLDTALLYGSHDFTEILTQGDLASVGYTELMVAIFERKFDIVKKLIVSKNIGDTINQVNNGSFSALMIAVNTLNSMFEDGNFDGIKQTSEIIKALLEAGADVKAVNKSHSNFFQLANTAGYFEVSSNLEHVYNICGSKEFSKANHGKNIFHIIMELGVNIIDKISELPISTVDYIAAINKLDVYGNSPLSYLLFDTKHDFDFDTIEKLILSGAKYIRNGIEYKQSQHLKAIATPEYIISGFNRGRIFTADEFKHINDRDENGRTALHEACIRGKQKIIDILLENDNTQINIQDNFGRTPVHYAMMNEDIFIPFSTGKLVADNQADPKELDVPDVFGITPLTLAFQNATKPGRLLDYQFKARHTQNPMNIHLNKLNRAIDPIMTLSDIAQDPVLNYQQKLALISCLRNYVKITGIAPDLYISQLEDTAKEVFAKAFESVNKQESFKRGFALGIELEIPGLVNVSFIPTKELISLVGATLVEDVTVSKTILGNEYSENASEKLEIVSGIIDSELKYDQFLAMSEALEQAGSKVNRSAGIHVHFNVRGSTATHSTIANFLDPEEHYTEERKKSIELDFLKYAALNFISIESILRGFVRDGVMFDTSGSAYVQTIREYKNAIENCTDIETLQRICSHNKTLDFTALDRHGTIEFRLHEGIVDPILINAWVNCMSRLVIASKDQAFAHKAGQKYAPKQDIEQLIYLLITMREYNKTWDSEWGAVKSSETQTTSIYPGHDKRPVQIQIQEAPLYNMMQLVLQSKSIDDISEYENISEFATKLETYIQTNFNVFTKRNENEYDTLQELKKLVIFTNENPGYFPETFKTKIILAAIDKAYHNLKDKYSPLL